MYLAMLLILLGGAVAWGTLTPFLVPPLLGGYSRLDSFESRRLQWWRHLALSTKTTRAVCGDGCRPGCLTAIAAVAVDIRFARYACGGVR